MLIAGGTDKYVNNQDNIEEFHLHYLLVWLCWIWIVRLLPYDGEWLLLDVTDYYVNNSADVGRFHWYFLRDTWWYLMRNTLLWGIKPMLVFCVVAGVVWVG